MPTVIVRSLLARVGTVLIAVGVLLLTATVWLSDGYGNGLRALSGGLLFLVGVWLLWWRPSLVLTTDALTVRNAWHTHVVDWQVVARTGTRWGLEIVTTDQRTVRASAAPRGGGFMAGLHQHIEATQGRRGGAGRDDGGRRVTREELVTPGDGTYRVSLDATQGGDLLELYAAEVSALARLRRRQSHRAERLAAHRGRDRREPVPEPSAPSPTVSSRLNLGSVVVSALAVLAVVLTTLLP